MIGITIGFDYPRTCEYCKLFVDCVGHSFCSAGGEYSESEIENEKEGSLQMYYNGCLSHRPENCPLKEVFLDDGGDPDAN